MFPKQISGTGPLIGAIVIFFNIPFPDAEMRSGCQGLISQQMQVFCRKAHMFRRKHIGFSC